MAKITKELVKMALISIGIKGSIDREYVDEVLASLNPNLYDDIDTEDMSKSEADEERITAIATDLMEMACDNRLYLTPWGEKRLEGVESEEVKEARGDYDGWEEEE